MTFPVSGQYLKGRMSMALLILVALATLVAWFFLSQASQTTTAVIRLHQLASEKELLRRENAQLHYQIAVLESTSHLRGEAQEMGFAPPQETEYLPLAGYSPSGDDPAASSDSTPESEPASGPGLWDRFTSHLLLLITGQASVEVSD